MSGGAGALVQPCSGLIQQHHGVPSLSGIGSDPSPLLPGNFEFLAVLDPRAVTLAALGVHEVSKETPQISEESHHREPNEEPDPIGWEPGSEANGGVVDRRGTVMCERSIGDLMAADTGRDLDQMSTRGETDQGWSGSIDLRALELMEQIDSGLITSREYHEALLLGSPQDG